MKGSCSMWWVDDGAFVEGEAIGRNDPAGIGKCLNYGEVNDVQFLLIVSSEITLNEPRPFRPMLLSLWVESVEILRK
jgi:hypothetical protein